ncbi:NAD-dependent epimerase/dehydratase family protein [Alphaproteobacteria bacterium]|nr:NAD-dependent epimerase/dehydratase family protein [Alphaproteobacteria bacterium]
MRIILTGCAGFIGMHTAKKLLERGDEVLGIDNINDYYDVNLKKDRLKILSDFKNFKFQHLDLCNEKIFSIFQNFKTDNVISLGAQAGVRFSLTNPKAYIDSNVYGFLNILEACRKFNIKNLVYASSSSVYGANKSYPFHEDSSTDHPVSLYAASKKTNELMAHVYSNNYDIPSTGLRFFTVYGPWGRPDMAGMIFIKSIIEGKPIKIFNNGNMFRDFTYIDDIVKGIIKVNDKIPSENHDFDHKNPVPSSSSCKFKIFNIGNSKPIKLIDFIDTIEKKLNIKAIKIFEKIQLGDVEKTFSDSNKLQEWINFSPNTNLDEGISKLVDWYLEYYK